MSRPSLDLKIGTSTNYFLAVFSDLEATCFFFLSLFLGLLSPMCQFPLSVESGGNPVQNLYHARRLLSMVRRCRFGVWSLRWVVPGTCTCCKVEGRGPLIEIEGYNKDDAPRIYSRATQSKVPAGLGHNIDDLWFFLENQSAEGQTLQGVALEFIRRASSCARGILYRINRRASSLW